VRAFILILIVTSLSLGTISAVAPPAAGKSKAKVKKLKTVSSPRGEFTFRVPPVEMKYRISVTAKGFSPAEKIVAVEGGPTERVDANFTLSPESKH
jgi:hypothetical protein